MKRGIDDVRVLRQSIYYQVRRDAVHQLNYLLGGKYSQYATSG
jgi:hypothetical protein